MKWVFVLFFVVFINSSQQIPIGVIIKLTKITYNGLRKLDKFVNGDATAFNEINTIDTQIGGYDKHVKEGLVIFQTALSNLPEILRTELKLNDLIMHIMSIELQYEQFKTYMKKKYELHTYVDFFENVISSNSNSFKNRLIKIHSYLNSSQDGILGSSINKLLERKEVDDFVRLYGQSEQMVFSNLYANIALTQIKGELVLLTAYTFLQKYNGDYYQEIRDVRKEFKSRKKDILQIFYDIIKNKSRELWVLNRPNDKLGTTYEEITKFIQGFVQNEESLNNKKSCWNTCTDYRATSTAGFSPAKCEKRGCSGKVFNCQFLSGTFNICPSAAHSNRRYEYIGMENGNIGKKKRCPENECTVEYHRKMLITRCDYCVCMCDETNQYSDRYINLRPVYSDVLNNKVVTGVRFVKRNRIIHLQVQEAIMSSYGITSNHKWVPVDEYKITEKTKVDIDYHTLTQSHRTIDLDIVKTDSDYVVTGLKINILQGHLKLFVRATKFDIISGTLVKNSNIWINNQLATHELKLVNPEVPTLDTTFLRKRNHGKNQYIQFTPSDLMKDVAQTTVPFIDLQEVTIMSGPLQGIGLYHKGNVGFGGFIAPLVVTLDQMLIIETVKK